MMNRTLRTGRASLLARTALGGAALAASAWASPGTAQVTPGSGALGGGTILVPGTVNSVQTNGSGGTVFDNGVANTSTVVLGDNRTLIGWDGFNLTSGNTLNFVFGDKSGIVLNRVDAGAATINGALNANITTVGGTVGGNVWFVAPSGVVFGSNAVVNVGGLLATSGTIADSDFLDGDLSFTFTGGDGSANVRTEAGAALNPHGGTIALVADSVAIAAGSSIVNASAGDQGGILLGGAREHTITFVEDTGDNLDLFSWTVPSEAAGSGHIRPITIGGSIAMGNVYLAAVNRNVALASITVNGNVNATGAVANGDGNIVLTAGGGISNGTHSAAAGQATEMDMIGGVLSANRDVTVMASAGANMLNGLTMSAGRNIVVDAADIGLATVSAGQDVSLISDGFAMVTSLSFGDDYSITATGFGGSAMQTNLTAPGTGTGGDALRNLTIDFRAGPMSFGSPVSASGNLNVSATGNLSFSGVSSGGNITLVSGGMLNTNSAPITVGGDYSITAQDFTGGAFNPNFGGGTTNDFSITNTQASITVGSLSAPGTLTVTALHGGVTVAGALSSTNESISLNAGGIGSSIAINAAVTTGTAAGRSVDLSSAGSVSQNASGAITTNTLSGDAAGAIFLNSASNHIVNLGAMSAYSDIRINDASGGLALTGDIGVTDGFVLLTTPGVLAAGDVTLSVGSGKQMELTGSTVALNDTTIASRVEFNGPLTVGGTVTVGKSNTSAYFTGNVGGDGVSGDDTLNVVGTAVFESSVNNSLANLNVGSFANIYAGNTIAVSNDITFSSLVRVDGLTSGPVSINAGGDLVLGTLETFIGNVDLTLTGSTISTSGIRHSGATAGIFRNVTFNGATSLTGDLLAGGALTFNGPLALSTGSHAITAGDVSFLGTVDESAAAGVVGLNVTANGAGTSDNVTFTGSVGATRSMDTLTVNGPTALAGATFATTGSQSWNGPITLTGGGTKAFNGGSGAVSFNGSVDGGSTLNVAAGGGITFAGAVGAGTRLTAVNTSGGGVTNLNGGNILTTVGQSYSGSVSLGADTVLDAQAGGIIFNAGITGAFALELRTPADSFLNGAVNIASLTTDAGGNTRVNNSSIVTSGDQSYGDVVILGGAGGTKTFSGNNGSFAQGVQGGGNNLTLNFSGTSAIGSNFTGINDLSVGGGGTTSISGTISTTGSQTYGDALSLGGNAILASSGALTSGNITLAAVAGDGNSLSVQATNGATTASLLGAISSLSTFDVVAGRINIDAAVSAATSAMFESTNLHIAGTGLITAPQVVLNGATGVGTSTNRIQINAQTLAASGGSGGVWIDEADGVSLQTLGPVGNQAAARYDLVAGGDIDVAHGITAAGGTVSLVSTAGDLIVRDTATITAGGGGNAELTASGSISALTGSQIIAQDIHLTAANWLGNLFSDGILLETEDVFITDAAGGLILSGISATNDLNVAVTGGGTLDANNAVAGGDLTLTAGNVNINSPVSATQNILISATTGDIAITSGGTVTAGGDAILSAAEDFRNYSDGDAVSAGGHWVIYAEDPATSVFDGLDSGQTAIWNATMATLDPDSASGDRYVFAYQPTVTITSVDTDKVYGTDLSGNVSSLYTVTGIHPGVAGAFLGDTAATAFSGAPIVASDGIAERADVTGGPYGVTIAAGTVAGLNGYAVSVVDGNAEITVTPKPISGTPSADDKTYDGTPGTNGSISLTGVLSGDDVAADGTFTFADKNAGVDKIVTVSGLTLAGDDAGNYTITLTGAALADIFQKVLTASAFADDRTYDGTTTATGSITLDGVIGGDDVDVGGAVFAFADENAGSDKTVTISGATLSGSDAGNYSVTFPVSALADIFQKVLTAGATADDKTYDGTTSGTGSITLTGVVGGDDVDVSGAVFTFADKNAGTDKTVTISGATLSGTDAGNYSVTFPLSALADIFQKVLTAGATADDKTYDGTTAATGSITLTGVVGGDDVDVSGAVFAFADKNAGTDKTVTISGATLSGSDAGNYSVTFPVSALADIFQKALTAGATADHKSYDGTTSASGSITLDGVVGGDDVDVSGAVFTFADKNAGADKTVTISGATLIGTDAGNYSVTFPASALADILQKAITGTVAADDKVYDGTTAATGTVTFDGVVDGDDVSASGGTLAFADKNAGTDKTVTISGVTLSGDDAGNYVLTLPETAVADILQKAISATIVANDKTYDGTTAASGSATLNGVVAGDSVAADLSFAFADRNAGADKTVLISGGLAGEDAGNYALTLPSSVVADIFQKAIEASILANDKTYDGTTAGSGTVSLAGLIEGDDVAASGGTFTFADKNAGTDKAVTVSGVTLAGNDAGNYVVTFPTSVLADILQKQINGIVVAEDKVYDGTAAATGTMTLEGVIAGDAVSGSVTLAFADANAGTDKLVLISNGGLFGADAGNYVLTLPPSVLADILKRAITVTADPAGKQGGEPDPALTWGLTDGSLVEGETLTGSLSRQPGEQPGDYAILQGTLAASSNYDLTFVGSTFTIEVTPEGMQDLRGYLENAGQGEQIDREEAPLLIIGEGDCEEGREGADCPAAMPTAMVGGGAGRGGR